MRGWGALNGGTTMNVRSRNRSFFPRFRQGAAPLGRHPVEKRDSLFANGLRETVFAVKCFLAQSSQAENCVDCYFGCIARRYLFRILLCAGLLVGASTRLALGEGPQSFDFETTLQPVVNEPVHEYLNVTFQPGD